MSCVWTRAFRSIASTLRTTSGSLRSTRRFSTAAQPTMALSGVRSSCDSPPLFCDARSHQPA